MTAEHCRSETSALLCPRVTADADPSVLPRLLRHVQSLETFGFEFTRTELSQIVRVQRGHF